MTLKTPILMQAAGGDTPPEYSAMDLRSLLDGLFRGEGIMRPDVPGGGLKVSQRAAGANFSVDVAAGRAMIAGDAVSDQGLYMAQSTAVENLVVPAPPVSGSRTHRVVAQLNDHLHDGGVAAGTYSWTLLLLEDTGSGTPAVPASALALARVAVAAGQVSVTNANITDDRVTAPLVTSKPSLVASDATRPPNPYDGELIWRTDKGCHEVAVSGAWYEISRSGGGGSAWTPYTPSLTASTTNPTLGSGSVRNGAWTREGRKVTVNGNIVFGSSGAGAGSGTYRVSVPVTAKTLTGGYHMGSAFGNDTSANNGVDGISRIGAGAGWDKIEMMLNNVLVTNAAPFTWGNSDIISFTITYEAAT